MARPLKSDATPADRLGAMLPAEVTGLYVSIRALFEGPASTHVLLYIGFFAALSLIVSLLYIRIVRKVTNGVHLTVYAILFINWVVALDVQSILGAMPEEFRKDVPLTAIVGAISFILSFAVPIILPNSTVSSEKTRSGGEPRRA